MVPAYWSNRITWFRRTREGLVREGEFEGCFWKRRDSLLYEGGRRRSCRAFLVRVPRPTGIAPGDALVLGVCREGVDEDFLMRRAGDSFIVRQVLTGSHTRCEGVNLG